jgi:hypothetical protein
MISTGWAVTGIVVAFAMGLLWGYSVGFADAARHALTRMGEFMIQVLERRDKKGGSDGPKTQEEQAADS